MVKKSKLFNKDEIKFYQQLTKRVFAMAGFTYFSVAVALSSWTTFTPSLLAGFLYGFSELMRFYKVVEKVKPTKLNSFDFMI